MRLGNALRLGKVGPVLALCLSLATAGLATPGYATPGQDIVTASLHAQGFEITLVHWTLLGRIRIIAVSADIRREIVINPNTGEILRDYSQRIVAAVPQPNEHHDSPSPGAVARLADPAATDLDASAVTALESMEMGVAPPILADTGQN